MVYRDSFSGAEQTTPPVALPIRVIPSRLDLRKSFEGQIDSAYLKSKLCLLQA
jgi:hypothetical protein